MRASRKIAFVGPTYSSLAHTRLIESAGFEVLPPVARGEIDSLPRDVPHVIVVVDGRFNHALAVGHAELRRAAQRGWTVWGVSSMGAIRAFEMRTLNVRGFGVVYGHFLASDDFQDDEVSLLHAQHEPYTPLSEPLVHLRHCLAYMEQHGHIESAAAACVARELKQLWFAERTLDAFVGVVERIASTQAAAAAESCVGSFDQFRVKTHDLVSFFEGRVWEHASTYLPVPVSVPYMDACEERVA